MDQNKTEMEFSLDTFCVFELIPSNDENKNWILDSSEIKKNKHHFRRIDYKGLTLIKGMRNETPEVKDMKIVKKENKEFLTVTMDFPTFYHPSNTLNFNDEHLLQ